MLIDNKYNIGDMVKFGPFMAIITGLRIAGDSLSPLYEISFFDGCDNYKMQVAYDFELETEKAKFGFGKGE